MKTTEIIIASNNKGKLREIQEICSDTSLFFKTLKDVWPDTVDIAETGTTFVENARIKAEWVYSKLHTWVLADDSGLEVDALNGEPGVYSARYAGEQANDERNIQKLLYTLRDVPGPKRSARFRCVIVIKGPESFERVFEGVCEGTIVAAPGGVNGFGYDPLFIPKGYSVTFAEMEQNEKNRISHRGKALIALKKGLHEIFR